MRCPDARKKREEPAVPELGIAKVEQPAPTPAAGRAKRLVYMALEDYYDEDRKNYKPGHSDASIAQEFGVSEACVRQIREESFGPLVVPLDLNNILTDVRAMRRELEAAHAAQSAALADSHKAEVAKAEALELRITRLIEANGWKAK